MSNETRLNLLSPDGIQIEFGVDYANEEEAYDAFCIWIERFKSQGYYSSNNGRIPLDDLIEYCDLKKVKV